MKKTSIILFSVLVSGCATNQGLFKGENLLQAMPLPESSWVEYEKQEGRFYQRMWSKNNHKDQVFTLVIKEAPNRSLLENKAIDDQAGHIKCDKFVSEDSIVKVENSYKTLTWVSTCKIDEKEITVLHKTISGNDSFYHVRRVGRAGLDKKMLSIWKEYFSTIMVCDTRSINESRCPDG